MDVKPRVLPPRKGKEKAAALSRKEKAKEIIATKGAPSKRTRRKNAKDLKESDYVAIKKEKNRNCAKACRARKKVRYVYLEDFIEDTEERVRLLHKEMKHLKHWGRLLDNGVIPPDLLEYRNRCVESDSDRRFYYRQSRVTNAAITTVKPDPSFVYNHQPYQNNEDMNSMLEIDEKPVVVKCEAIEDTTTSSSTSAASGSTMNFFDHVVAEYENYTFGCITLEEVLSNKFA